ncbi:hypothetical protein ColTof3_08141 [Colletotrichum tofieldiae]|nr:hypothetical protein ColTof3_08141 [Colletotrichum tofieldiae]
MAPRPQRLTSNELVIGLLVRWVPSIAYWHGPASFFLRLHLVLVLPPARTAWTQTCTRIRRDALVANNIEWHVRGSWLVATEHKSKGVDDGA